jgi:uncharacterized protein (TIGR02453 family)
MGQHMTPPVFPPEAAELLKSLGENNNRDFFTANRAVYDRAIRGPLEELLSRAQDKYGPGKITRANRDVRFSPDKTSYRIDASMWAGPVGAVYLRLTATGIEAGGGLYDPTRDQLARARAAIAHKPTAAAELASILRDLHVAGFQDAGDSLATAPRGFDRDDPNIELLRLRHYAVLKYLPGTATDSDIDEVWAGIEPLIHWVAEHVGAAQSRP